MPEPPDEGVLADALAPWKLTTDALGQAVAKEPTTQLALEDRSDEEILESDPVALNRVTYIVSLLRLSHFLRRKPECFSQEEGQAKIACAYIKNMESSRLQALQIGRSSSDLTLRDEVQTLRKDMDEIAEYKARALNKRGSSSGRSKV